MKKELLITGLIVLVALIVYDAFLKDKIGGMLHPKKTV
jgi:hypothetical protein